tara:strand:- start:847 stop:1512 length:666 start_codon:yes stop_codon:yes gene_type:complete
LDKKKLNKQSQHWENSFSSKPEMFGLEPSAAAIKSLKLIKEKNIKSIVELGAGLGRDTIFFAKNSIHVKALDYSLTAVKIINKKIEENNLSKFISTKVFDIRKKLPFEDNSIEACFSHMLYCMALSNLDLKNLNNEVFRILKPGGINIYTVRNIYDGDYKKGIYRGENLYENEGFIVHFFSKEKIKKLSKGFQIMEIDPFDEGKFPRKLFRVILTKQQQQQ